MLRIAINHRICIGLFAASMLACGAASDATADDLGVQYNRDVRPILADKCFRCHGPDAAARQADMRLDERNAATANRDGNRVITPGQPTLSELIRRVTSTAADQKMPPPDSGSTLRLDEIETLRRWIREGAVYQSHWSFVPPRRSKLPIVKDAGWSSHPIDRFVLDRLELEGLRPSAAADSSMLIRRVTLDLTGLPPTLEEIDAFERDSVIDAELAFCKLVDRLLASPRYGERMSQGWLDAARYADTNGYFTDNDRTMWPWRDWVIDAFNENMPFDQFTIEQLAGDLLVKELEKAAAGSTNHVSLSESQISDLLIATGFNRNHTVNNETGIIEEEFRVEYVVDRVDTTSTVWLGLTLGCARCHDHKYDPISQRDFYRFFSFFNNVPERGLSGSSGNAAPFLRVPSVEQQIQIERLKREVAAVEQQFAAVEKRLDAAQTEWEKSAIANLPKPTNEGLVLHHTLDDELARAVKNGAVKTVPGMLGNAAEFAGDAWIEIPDVVDFERTDAFSIAAWIQPQGVGCVISKTDDADSMRGFDVTLRKGKAVVNLVHRLNGDAIQVSTASSILSGQWQHLLVTYDGSSRAVGITIYVDGQAQPVEIGQDNLTRSMRNNQPVRIGRLQASGSFSGLIDDVRIYDRQLTKDEVHNLATSQLVSGVVARPLAKRSADQMRKLRVWFIDQQSDAGLKEASTELENVRRRQTELLNRVPTTMVMEESDKPRSTFMLARGQYDQPGEEVTAGFPEFLESSHHAPRDAASPTETNPSPNNNPIDKPPSNRLDMARWLVDPANPLTARVTVNRLWQQLFGTGIVKTVDDFGTQGDWPSHPELLDWLALELIESGWDLKHMLRLIATSKTYRQSSRCEPELLERDRENRWLARGSRLRMEAETLRDNALSIGGLLVEKIGGPSVNPYQPAGLWEDVTYDGDLGYQQGRGESLYRRSLYTFWKRQAPPPNMLVFDAPTRETCSVERSRTNTPLQALVLMNDPTFVEAARKLAEQSMTRAADSHSDRAVFVFRSVTARRPTSNELQVVLSVFESQRKIFSLKPEDATKLLNVGESSRDASLNAADLAAWTAVTSMLLSLDEAITRQ